MDYIKNRAPKRVVTVAFVALPYAWMEVLVVLLFISSSISAVGRGGGPGGLGHPAKNDCSTEVLLDFCTRVTFLRSVPVRRRLAEGAIS
jgi:hypothetical protein